MDNRKNIYKENEKGQILLLSLVLTIFLALLLGAAAMRSSDQAKETIQRRGLQEAFYAAETAIDRAVFNLRQNSGWRPDPTFKENFDIVVSGTPTTIGYYWTKVVDQDPSLPPPQGTNGWRSCWITAQGKDAGEKYARTIQALAIVESPTNFLISTMGPLHIGSGLTFNADTLAKDIYFDINPAVTGEAKNINLNGDVFYMNSVTGNTTANAPFLKWGSGKTVKPAATITFAGVDLNRYKGIAQNYQSSNTGLYLDASVATIQLDNLEVLNPDPPNLFKPQIIYSTGDIRINGTYDNSILIIAAGDIFIENDIIPDGNLATPPQIGLFAKGDVIIPESANNTLNIEAFILADGNGGTGGKDGVFVAKGAKFSKDKLNFKGSISVRGKGTNAVDLNTFSTRNYDFNPDLRDNRTIPFTPFIVNIVRWQECKDAACT